MPYSSVSSVVGAQNVSKSALSLSSLSDVDYADQFTISTNFDATPEQWAREVLGDVPSIGETIVWRVILGFRLKKERSPATVAGWQIGKRDKDGIRLETASWFLRGNILVQLEDRRVSVATILKYDRLIAYVIWPVVSILHRRVVPQLLSGAAERLGKQQ